MAARLTRSRALASELSPEVVYYLESRGYELPTVRPRVRTPEPRDIKGALFDAAAVDDKIRALRFLRHTKGKWAGKPLEPTNVQVAYFIAPIFGWKHRDSSGDMVRIIRDVYIEMPRKGAKTTLASGLGFLLAFADGEPGAEVLMGAASRDQAGAAFKPLAALAKGSRVLQDAGVRALRTEIVQDSTGSVIRVVSSRGELSHGANVHGGLVDELHVHRSPDLLEAIESGTGARSQPMVIIITTADDGKTTSVYAQRREMVEKVAKRTIKAPSMYGIVFAADDGDDPFVEATWAKANPLYPVTPSPEFLRSAADKARANPVALASFLRLHLGIRAKQDKAFFDLTKWDRARGLVDESKLVGRVAFGGLDLAAVSDLTALGWLFPDEAGGYDVLCRFWLPEEALPALDAATARSASGWVREGWLTVTPGNVTDYDFIKRQIRSDMGTFDVQGVGYDRWNATQLTIDLEGEGVPVEPVGQGFGSASAPLKEINRLVLASTPRAPLFRHNGNPVLRWMADNLRPAVNASGDVKPDKSKSMNKIDGISALTTAMYVAMHSEPTGASVYETQGVMTV